MELRHHVRAHWRRLAWLFAILGPGVITSNVDNDSGGIYTYSVAGARYGYTLLWVLVPVTVALVVVQEMCSRMGTVTGKGMADLIRGHFDLRTTFLIMMAVLVTNFGNTVAEFAGVASSFELFGISRYVSVPLGAAFVWWLVVFGSYKSVEKAFLIACLVYLAYPFSGLLAQPNWTQALEGSVLPRMPLDVAIPSLLSVVPSSVTEPESGSMRRFTMRSVVDLPQPEGPMRTHTQPSGISSERSSTAGGTASA